MSPLGLKVLTGAGFKGEDEVKHVHVTIDVATDESAKFTVSLKTLISELGLPGTTEKVYVCADKNINPYATILDSNGAIKGWVSKVEFDNASAAEQITVDENNELTGTATDAANETIKLDFYVVMSTGATEITIEPNDFGGYFYVEADTLYRNQDGKDMAATLTFPKVKIQSGFTLTMAANGDPSTFDFVMDAFPAYTYFDATKKVVCDMTIVDGGASEDSSVAHAGKHLSI